MQTLISGQSDRWYPASISKYKSSIRIYGSYDERNRLQSNFAYSMQYIEYLEKQVRELKLSNVLCTMVYKTYIITGMSIIEGLFNNLLHHTNKWKTSDWEEKTVIVSNPKKVDGKEIKVETHLLEKVEPYELRMDFDSMIKKVESSKLITVDHEVFPVLKKLRELRNRVHLQVGISAYDHDYNKFGSDEIIMMREILYTILTCKEFCMDLAPFQFLKEQLFMINREEE